MINVQISNVDGESNVIMEFVYKKIILQLVIVLLMKNALAVSVNH